MDSAYAAGMDSSNTRMVEVTLADSEFASAGHGLPPPPKNSRYPWKVSGANTDGGLVAAFGSLCREVSSIHSTGRTNSTPTTHATTVSTTPARLRGLRRGAPVVVRVAGIGAV